MKIYQITDIGRDDAWWSRREELIGLFFIAYYNLEEILVGTMAEGELVFPDGHVENPYFLNVKLEEICDEFRKG